MKISIVRAVGIWLSKPNDRGFGSRKIERAKGGKKTEGSDGTKQVASEELVNFFSDKWLCATELSDFGFADTTRP